MSFECVLKNNVTKMGNKIDEKELYLVCKNLRELIDRCVKQHPNLFKDFPKGFCNHVSIWTYDYLHSLGYKNIEFYVSDNFLSSNNHYGHVWLNSCGLNIDLTCDQFNSDESKFEPVIVSSTNDLYNNFHYKVTRKEQVDLEYCNPYRDQIFPNALKERNIIYDAMGIEFKLDLPE